MDIEAILRQMTLEEKARMLEGATNWDLYGVERLGVPSIRCCDGPHGVRVYTDDTYATMQNSTLFPCASAMSATWNRELIREMGKTIGRECRYFGVDLLLAPGVNNKRSPLAGRNFEYYSEDPYLTGEIACAYIDGIQSEGVGTCIKHFVCNEQETARYYCSAEVDEQTLREIYLLPFETAIKTVKPWTIMGSYNRLRGVPTCENAYLLQKILREEWGFDGVVISDWTATNDKVACHRGGMDLEMPPAKQYTKIIAAVESGELEEGIVNDRVRDILRLISRVAEHRRTVQIDLEQDHEMARRVAAESTVLLKNEGGFLPLVEGSRIAVIGEFAKVPRCNGGGSSTVQAHITEIPYDEIARYADVAYAPGYTESGETTDTLVAEAVAAARGADAVILFAGTTPRMESEGADRQHMRLPDGHIRLIQEVAAANPSTAVILNSGSAVEVRQFETAVPAIMEAWFAGGACGKMLAKTLFGRINPSGKLAETFPIRLENTPAYHNFPGKLTVEYKEGLLTGYRHYDTRCLPVQYPFGHGLSYTQFRYDNLQLSKQVLTNGETLVVSAEITNIGPRDGAEIVQLYIHDDVCSYRRPQKELRNFVKVFLKAGETKTVTMELGERSFSMFVPSLGRFAVESGTFQILLGSSSADIRLSGSVEFCSSDNVKERLTLEYPINIWKQDPETDAQIAKMVEHTRPIEDYQYEWPVQRYIDRYGFDMGLSDSEIKGLKAMMLDY